MGNFCKKEEEGAARRGKEKGVAARRGRRKRGRRHQQMGLGPSSSLSFFLLLQGITIVAPEPAEE